VAVALAGCAAPASTSTVAGAGAGAGAWQQVTDCIRRNGMPDWPDPTPGPDGTLGFPADAPHTTQRVQQACAAKFAALSQHNTASPAPASSHDVALLLQLARCLRTHGYPSWPDPGTDGRFPYAAVSAIAGAKSALVSPPAPCRAYVPSGGIHVAS
jgi:hypothetical protein